MIQKFWCLNFFGHHVWTEEFVFQTQNNLQKYQSNVNPSNYRAVFSVISAQDSTDVFRRFSNKSEIAEI